MTEPNPARPVDWQADNVELKPEDLARMRPAAEALPPAAMAAFKRAGGSPKAPARK